MPIVAVWQTLENLGLIEMFCILPLAGLVLVHAHSHCVAGSGEFRSDWGVLYVTVSWPGVGACP